MITNFKSTGEKIDFLEHHIYEGTDLGVTYTPETTTFKVWSPLAKEVCVNIYETGNSEEDSFVESIDCTQVNNVWTVTIYDDLEGYFYTYSFIHHDNSQTETADIYSKAVGLNGNRTAIVNLADTDPESWHLDSHVLQPQSTDAMIWEVHIGDFSNDPSSGISPENRGKYLAFTEKNTSLFDNGEFPTGVSYLKNLGVNYVHLLPAFDSENDEEDVQHYNWGYDPKNYNVPEGKYSSNPADPKARIIEFKQMVQSIHEEGIGVVLDVVYNHTYWTKKSWFSYSVPDYYYRQDSHGNFADGSGCGNETASERKMMRKYIIESILYWAKEYHIDGFRFDLMGLHDVGTMNAIRIALDDEGLDNVILYGEPWNGGSVAIYEPNKPADKFHIDALENRIAIFNDDFRDSIKGPVFNDHQGGFLQGENGKYEGAYTDTDLISAITANTQESVGRVRLPEEKAWSRNPTQVISYSSAHDNLTLYDKLVATTSYANYNRHEELIRLNKINAAILFTSQGGMFFQAGEEFARTKYGDKNSYQSSIAVNRLDWTRAEENKDLVDYYKGMIELRKNYAPLRDPSLSTANQIAFAQLPENMLAYTIPNTIEKNPKWKMMAVIVNTNGHPISLDLKAEKPLPDEWTIVANHKQAGISSLGTIQGNHVIINPKEVLILVS